MNFSALRGIIGCIIFWGALLFIKIEKVSNKRIKSIIALCATLLAFFIYCVPLESIFLKFDNLLEAFNYSFPKDKYIDYLETNSSALVLSDSPKNGFIVYDFYKSGSKWKYRYPFKYSKSTKYQNGILADKFTYGNEDLAIIVVYLPKNQENVIIKDDYNNMFYELSDEKYMVYYCKVTNYSQEYTIYVNDNSIKP